MAAPDRLEPGVDILGLGLIRRFHFLGAVCQEVVDPVAEVRRLTEDGWDGGAEFAFEATGVPACTEQAIKMLSYGGTAMLTLLFGFGLLMGVWVHRDEMIGRRAAAGD